MFSGSLIAKIEIRFHEEPVSLKNREFFLKIPLNTKNIGKYEAVSTKFSKRLKIHGTYQPS